MGVLDEEPGGWGEGEEEEVVYDGRQDGAGPAAGALSQDPDAEPGRPGGGRKAGEVAKAMTRCELGGGLVPLGLVGGGLVPLAWVVAGSGWGQAGAAGLGSGWVWLGAGWCDKGNDLVWRVGDGYRCGKGYASLWDKQGTMRACGEVRVLCMHVS